MAVLKKRPSIIQWNLHFFQDADNEYEPKDFEKFFYVIENFKPDCIIGSRFKFNDYIRSHYFFNKIEIL